MRILQKLQKCVKIVKNDEKVRTAENKRHSLLQSVVSGCIGVILTLKRNDGGCMMYVSASTAAETNSST